MLFGLSIGLAVALIVYLKSPTPTELEGQIARTAGSAEVLPETTGPAAAPEPASTQARAEATETASDDPELFFYTGLRDSEVIVEDDEFDFGGPDGSGRMVLIQAGAFPDIRRADSHQADLALLGIESQIVPAVVNGEMLYRVSVGPLSGRSQVNRTRRRLAEHDIDYFIVPYSE
jgi:hypothetical protein